MLMEIKCSAVTSIEVNLSFDDGTRKDVVIEKGDLVSVEYNHNGLRKHVEGKVLKVSVIGTDPKGWYIIVDASNEFESNHARFSPMNIYDIDIISKGDSIRYIESPKDFAGIRGMRVIEGRLQYTVDGIHWQEFDTGVRPPRPPYDEDYEIKDEVY